MLFFVGRDIAADGLTLAPCADFSSQGSGFFLELLIYRRQYLFCVAVVRSARLPRTWALHYNSQRWRHLTTR